MEINNPITTVTIIKITLVAIIKITTKIVITMKAVLERMPMIPTSGMRTEDLTKSEAQQIQPM